MVRKYKIRLITMGLVALTTLVSLWFSIPVAIMGLLTLSLYIFYPIVQKEARLAMNSEILNKIYSLVAEEKPDQALDILFQYIDGLFTENKFDQVNDFLTQVDIELLDTNLMVGVLSITLPGAPTVPARDHLYRKIKNYLYKHEPANRAKRLIEGLK